MRIWHYHPDTGVLLGQGAADPDPLELQQAQAAAFEEIVGPAREAFTAALAAQVEARANADASWNLAMAAMVDEPDSPERQAAVADYSAIHTNVHTVQDEAVRVASESWAAALAEGEASAEAVEPVTWLIPAHATVVEPPAASGDQVVVFVDGDWEIQDLSPAE
jgi:hypothetical protein